MRLQPIVYVTDMASSLGFYGRLLDALPAVTSEHWSTFEVGGATLALHLTDVALGAGMVELSLVADTPLEDIHARAGDPTPIVEQPFGRSFTVSDPDGASIQVNEHS